jgi:hypothetical protein
MGLAMPATATAHPKQVGLRACQVGRRQRRAEG